MKFDGLAHKVLNLVSKCMHTLSMQLKCFTSIEIISISLYLAIQM